MKALVFLSAYLYGASLFASNIDSVQIMSVQLPVVWVETENHEEPSYDKATTPDGWMGHTIKNATKVPGRMWMTYGDSTLYDSGDFNEDVSGIAIKIRGNTSALLTEKKPYKLNLQKKKDLMGRGDKYADKEWLLLKAEDIKEWVGLLVNKLMGMPWSPSCKFVNVVLNGNYKGLYALTESVKRNTKCRLNVGKDGFIVEHDPYWWNCDTSFYTDYYRRYYSFKYPNDDDVDSLTLNYAKTTINQFEKGLQNHNYEDFIDLSSFARWLLGHDILGTYDGCGSNIYVMKKDSTNNSKLEMGNLWDFDSIEKREGQWSNIHNGNGNWFYFNYLINNSNKTFTKEYKQVWENIKPWMLEEIINKLDSFSVSDEAQGIDVSYVLDAKRWDTEHKSIKEETEDTKSWFRNRWTWLDEAISQLNDGDAINAITADGDRSAVYDLNGRRVTTNGQTSTALPKGIYIRNGKKVVK